MDRSVFDEGMTGLQAYYNYTIPTDRSGVNIYEMYWRMLSDMQNCEFTTAVKNIIASWHQTSTVRFPAVADFRASGGISGKTRATGAISRIRAAVRMYGRYLSVDFGDKILHHVIKQVGGWCAVCDWDNKKWDINHQRLIEMYDSAIAAGVEGIPYLAGQIEIHNGAIGDGYNTDIKQISGGREYYEPQKAVEKKQENTISLPNLSAGR